jgi:hypothetical protein
MVNIILRQSHRSEGPDQRHGNGNPRNHRGTPVPQKDKDDKDHQPDRNPECPFHIVQGGTNRGGLIENQSQDLTFGNGCPQGWQLGLEPVHGLNDIGARLFEDDQVH